MDPHCHYPPLPCASRTFRLLSLEPGHDGDAIICALRVANIPETSSCDVNCIYNAVSYAWGDGDSKCEILVDAWRVPVRENLWQLLKHFRSTTTPVTLWIDFLCIDQSDKKEQAIQVQTMDKIYKGAQQVWVWLGMPGPEDLQAMDLIQTIAETSFDAFSKIPGAYNALLHWSNRCYWSRAWVVQEFVLGRDLVVQCGTICITWTTLSLFLQRLERERPRAKSNPAFTMFLNSPAHALVQQKAEYTSMPMSLMKLLVRNQRTLCKDRLDKVYSLLGLAAGSGGGPQIQVSYTKSRLQLMHEVLAHCDIQPRNTARYVRFMSQILAIEPTTMQQGAMATSYALNNHNALRTLPGFVIGEVLDCEELSPILDSNGMARSGLERTSIFQRAAHGHSPELTSLMAHACVNLDVDELERKFNYLGRKMHTRARHHEVHRWKPMAHEAVRAFLVSVFTSGCARPEIIVGIACGQLTRGLQIVQFLNCEIGLVVERSSSRNDDPPIMGLAACIRGSGTIGQRLLDTETQQELRCHSISSEVEGADDLVRINFNQRLLNIALLVG